MAKLLIGARTGFVKRRKEVQRDGGDVGAMMGPKRVGTNTGTKRTMDQRRVGVNEELVTRRDGVRMVKDIRRVGTNMGIRLVMELRMVGASGSETEGELLASFSAQSALPPTLCPGWSTKLVCHCYHHGDTQVSLQSPTSRSQSSTAPAKSCLPPCSSGTSAIQQIHQLITMTKTMSVIS